MNPGEVVERLWTPAGGLARVAGAWIDAGSPAGAPPRSAATVMLLRDGEAGVEVFMMRRVRTMEFAPSMWVFPGGGVDARDVAGPPDWSGPSAQQWAERLEVSVDEAVSLVVAAAREVFEESGVLLASRGDGDMLAPADHPQRAADRAALLNRDLSFAELLRARGLTLRTDLLQVQDHWVTPEFEPKRYDTWFFAALLPAGQEPDDDTTESDVSTWVRPADLLAAKERGEALMLPPTELQLQRIDAATDAAAMVTREAHLMTVMPVAEKVDGEVRLRTRYLA
ncbi:NUDIX hydrolase [Calidifontibacter terrae]